MMNIFQAIPAIMADMGVVGKDKKNQQQGFMFRGIDDVMNATQPYFAKHKVFVVPNVIDRVREERVAKSGGTIYVTLLRVEFTFYSEDGTFIKATTDGEAMDSADKGTNKAMSIAFKYALFQVLDIPTEEMKDPDSVTPEETLPKNKKPVVKQEVKPEIKTISKEQATEILSYCKNDKGEWMPEKIKVMKDFGYSNTNDIPVEKFEEIKNKLMGDK